MRSVALGFLLASMLWTPSFAFVQFHSSQLPYDSVTVDCETIIAKANYNKYTKLVAANLYWRGLHLGEYCIKADKVKSVLLYKSSGYNDLVIRKLQTLQHDVDHGSSSKKMRAKRTLKALKKKGIYLTRCPNGKKACLGE